MIVESLARLAAEAAVSFGAAALAASKDEVYASGMRGAAGGLRRGAVRARRLADHMEFSADLLDQEALRRPKFSGVHVSTLTRRLIRSR